MRPGLAGLSALLLLIGVVGWWCFSRGLSGEAERAESIARIRKARSESSAKSAERDLSKTKRVGALSPQDKRLLDQVNGWLMDQTPGAPDWKITSATVNQLPLELLRELLANPEWFEDLQKAADDLSVIDPIYPRRQLLAILIWERIAKLAPQEALDLAFKSPGWEKDTWRAGPVLRGIAKSDPALVLQFLRNPPAGLDLHAAGLVSEQAEQLTNLLARHSPLETLQMIKTLPEQIQTAGYTGYVQTLGAGTDWEAELIRFGEELPELAELGFQGAAYCELADAWVLQDPDAAFARIGKYEDSIMVYRSAIDSWIQSEPAEAVEWLQSWQPEQGDPDRVYSEVLSGNFENETSTLDLLLGLFRDPAMRDQAVIRKMSTADSSVPLETLRHLQVSPLLSDQARQSVTTVLEARAGE